MKKHNLLIAGGGTGGHIAPALAVGLCAEKYFDVSYACTPRPVDRAMYRAANGTVHVMNPPRIDRGMKLLLPFSASGALFRAGRLLRKNRISAVLGTGGYSSYFAVVAARFLGIPAALLETNAKAGKSNRLASRFCREAYTGFKEGATGLHCRAVHTGTPVSRAFRKMDKDVARRELGVPADRPVILFLGGSQGASGINDLALGLSNEFTVLLQCGSSDFQRTKQLSAGKSNIVVEPFINDLSPWYSAAELAVARAGGQTIAELSVFQLPAVLIPFPFAAEDHQTANAAVVERVGAAVLRQQEGFSSDMLSVLLLQLISQSTRMNEMRRAMAGLFPENSAGRITDHLKELLQ